MYDFAHPIEDAIEGISPISICTLEFEDHRPLYDWVVRELEYPMPPRQIELCKAVSDQRGYRKTLHRKSW